MIRTRRFLSALILMATVAACQQAAVEQPSVAVDAGTTPAAATAVANQPGRDNPARILFETNCATCHGADLSGGRAPSLFSQRFLVDRTDTQIQQVVMQGIEQVGMPPFAGILSESEIWMLVTFIRNEAASLAERPMFVTAPDNFVVHSQKQTFRIEVLATGLEVPWATAFLPDGRILVTERPGRLRVLQDGQLLSEPVAGTPAVQVGQDAGMFDIALHPDYDDNGWIYLSYAETLPGYDGPELKPDEPGVRRTSYAPSMTVIIRGKITADNEWVETQELFRPAPELYTGRGEHFGSRFAFDDDGHLFYSIGDRGDMATAQDLSSPLGKIHRINDDGTVPADNPFVAVHGALPTIWSYGHRNPQGMAFDPHTGLLWESEHGPAGGDEINIIEPGKNYGWGVISMGLQRGITLTSAPGMEQPIVYYTPSIAPSRISFYTGDRYSGWDRSLFVAALGGQQLRRLEIDGRKVVAQEELFSQFGRTRAATVGPDGLFYVLLQNPTGSGTGLRLSAPTPGILVRLVPMDAETARVN